MNRRKKTGKRTRTSRYMHLWPELEFMPTLDHWPDRPVSFEPERSEVLAYIARGYRCDLHEAERIFQAARHARVIRYNPKTRLWSGRKGGLP
jgi:hypothetical protein